MSRKSKLSFLNLHVLHGDGKQELYETTSELLP